ncbi:unnamed protein product, partial [Laminaria digitata]
GETCQAGSPYYDPAEIPGTFQAEYFDKGGEGVGYSDSTEGNSGTRKIQGEQDLFDWGERKYEDVDVTETKLFNSIWVVGWISAGEYLRYTVNVTKEARGLVLSFRVSSPSGSGTFRLVSGGTDCDDYTADLTGLVHVDNTGGYDKYSTQRLNTRVGLSKGYTYIWLCVESGGFNIDYFSMEEDSLWLQMYD